MSCAYFLAEKGLPPDRVRQISPSRRHADERHSELPSRKDVVEAEIDILREMGVEFRCGVDVGRDVTIPGCARRATRGSMLPSVCRTADVSRVPGDGAEGVMSRRGLYKEGQSCTRNEAHRQGRCDRRRQHRLRCRPHRRSLRRESVTPLLPGGVRRNAHGRRGPHRVRARRHLHPCRLGARPRSTPRTAMPGPFASASACPSKMPRAASPPRLTTPGPRLPRRTRSFTASASTPTGASCSPERRSNSTPTAPSRPTR